VAALLRTRQVQPNRLAAAALRTLDLDRGAKRATVIAPCPESFANGFFPELRVVPDDDFWWNLVSPGRGDARVEQHALRVNMMVCVGVG
jgi:hypothetical protein